MIKKDKVPHELAGGWVDDISLSHGNIAILPVHEAGACRADLETGAEDSGPGGEKEPATAANPSGGHAAPPAMPQADVGTLRHWVYPH